MGASPIFALNIVAFPVKTLGTDALARLLEGGAAVAEEAGVPILGGHSVEDPEPKYGMAVTGLVHPDRILKNIGAHDGDVLFLTKPLGSGILTTALKREKLTDEQVAEVLRVMTTLNKAAGEAMTKVGVHAATDVTGFGVPGHLLEMLKDGTLGAEIEMGALPLMGGVLDVIAGGICPGGTKKNLTYFGEWLDIDESIPEERRLILADAQTSGGLLIACPPSRADALQSALEDAGAPASARIGRFTTEHPGRIRVRG